MVLRTLPRTGHHLLTLVTPLSPSLRLNVLLPSASHRCWLQSLGGSSEKTREPSRPRSSEFLLRKEDPGHSFGLLDLENCPLREPEEKNTTSPTGTVMVRALLSQTTLQLGLCQDPCTSAVTQKGGAGGDHSSDGSQAQLLGQKAGGAQGRGGAAPPAQSCAVV